jgi:DNA modification methylase
MASNMPKKAGMNRNGNVHVSAERDDLARLLPMELASLADPQTAIPALAKDLQATAQIERAVKLVPTKHRLFLCDSRELENLESESIHLVLTSPPYWTLKKYRDHPQQLGAISLYEEFLDDLDKVWRHCFRALVPGGRLICVVGDVCLSRRQNDGRHTVVPLHSSIQERCRQIGFDNLAPIIWHKISNAAYEVDNGSRFLGKPYEPNAVIKNDIEFILMERKPGGYRTPSVAARVLSLISADKHQQWFQQIWTGLGGASTKDHPAPYPLELAERLIRMFSFVEDTVMDPFMGTGTTNVAAARWGRNSIGAEVDSHYFAMARRRIEDSARNLFAKSTVVVSSPNSSHGD